MPTSDPQDSASEQNNEHESSEQHQHSENVQPLAGQVIPHSVADDLLGVFLGTFMAAMGLYLLEQAGAVGGGTAGVALLLSFATELNLASLFLLVNLPFFALAVWRKGWKFTLRTAASVTIVSGFVMVCEHYFPVPEMNPVFGVVAGNVLLGMALLAVFRHGASLGGFNILAIIAQEQFKMRAGYVQMSLDISVILLSLIILPPQAVLLSAGGAVLMNLILAFNHRPGRYLA